MPMNFMITDVVCCVLCVVAAKDCCCGLLPCGCCGLLPCGCCGWLLGLAAVNCCCEWLR
jgi:hypothetical protein